MLVELHVGIRREPISQLLPICAYDLVVRRGLDVKFGACKRRVHACLCEEIKREQVVGDVDGGQIRWDGRGEVVEERM